MKKYGQWMKRTGGVLLFFAAMASDGETAGLLATFLLAGTAVLLLAGGEWLCRKPQRARTFRLPALRARTQRAKAHAGRAA